MGTLIRVRQHCSHCGHEWNIQPLSRTFQQETFCYRQQLCSVGVLLEKSLLEMLTGSLHYWQNILSSPNTVPWTSCSIFMAWQPTSIVVGNLKTRLFYYNWWKWKSWQSWSLSEVWIVWYSWPKYEVIHIELVLHIELMQLLNKSLIQQYAK